MAELKESKFHGCICSKLENLTLPGADGQPWRSISVCISFGDYKKMFEIDKKNLPLPTENEHIPGNRESQMNKSNYEGPHENNTGKKSKPAVNISIVQATSSQDYNSNDHPVAKTRMNSQKKRKQTDLDSESEPNVSPLPINSSSRTKNRPKVNPLSNRISTPKIQNNTNKCITCYKEFSSKYNLNLHKKRKHSDEQSKADWSYECNVCFIKFPYSSDLNQHKPIHSQQRKFKCPDCPATYKWKEHLAIHLKTHEKDSLFRCKMCDKVLSSSYHLDDHSRIHTGEKPYQCEICDKSFARNNYLISHMLRAHSS